MARQRQPHDDGTVKLWNVKSGECVNTFDSSNGPVWCAAFSPQSEYLATGSRDGVAQMWDVQKGIQVLHYKNDSTFVWLARHVDSVRSIAWSSSCDKIATAAGDEAFLWSTSLPAQCTTTLMGHTGLVTVVSLSADGRTAFTASEDNTVKGWDAANGMCISRLDNHDDPLRFAAFTPNGHQILTASGSVCKLLDKATAECLRVFAGHADTVNWCEFSSDGAIAVTVTVGCEGRRMFADLHL